MKNFEVVIDNQVSKEYSTIEQAYVVFDRAVALIKAKQAKYDTVQLVDYIGVWNMNTSEFEAHCTGNKLMKKSALAF